MALAVADPFASDRENIRKYHTLALLGAVAMAAPLALPHVILYLKL